MENCVRHTQILQKTVCETLNFRKKGFFMKYINRNIEKSIQKSLKRGKSVLLLGPRQTGKTTAMEHLDIVDVELNLALTDTRMRYAERPSLLVDEVKAHPKKKPLIFVDEVQKIPEILDDVQYLVDKNLAQFILTGSSARKLRKTGTLNLLPGRVVLHHLDPVMMEEYTDLDPSLESLLYYGSLPEILLTPDLDAREMDLNTYVTTYLEEEIHIEAAVRSLARFSRFLSLAALESGNIVNFSKLSQEIGVAHTTIREYYQILEDCMIAERIEPYLKTKTRRQLYKSEKHIFFDLGVRRVSAREWTNASETRKGQLFEQFIGLELLRFIRSHFPPKKMQLHFWRSLSGPEVDWVVSDEAHKRLIPIEVKWTKTPTTRDMKHLRTFISEYDKAKMGYVVCRTPRAFQLADNVIALPWQVLSRVFEYTPSHPIKSL